MKKRTPTELLSALYELIDIESFDESVNARSLFEHIGHTVRNDELTFYEGEDLIDMLLEPASAGKIVDIGCGRGASREACLRIAPMIEWAGLEVGDTYNRPPSDRDDIHVFNGRDIPMDSDSVDFFYSKQVFEHVRYPEQLLGEIHRVLKPGGLFFGSVSGQEPYHFYSMFNFTPYGWYQVLHDNGFQVIQLSPGADGISVTLRHLSKNKKLFPGIFNGKSVLQPRLSAKFNNESIRKCNLRMLIYAAHIAFVSKKQEC